MTSSLEWKLSCMVYSVFLYFRVYIHANLKIKIKINLHCYLAVQFCFHLEDKQNHLELGWLNRRFSQIVFSRNFCDYHSRERAWMVGQLKTALTIFSRWTVWWRSRITSRTRHSLTDLTHSAVFRQRNTVLWRRRARFR